VPATPTTPTDDAAPGARGSLLHQTPVFDLRRPAEGAVLGGVAQAVAVRLRVDPVHVRLAFVVLASAGGIGVVLYLALYALTPPLAAADEPPPSNLPEAVQPRPQRSLALMVQVLGLLLVCRELGLWFGDAVVWPVTLAAIGSAVIWSRSDAEERERLARLAARVPGDPLRTVLTGPRAVLRVTAGALLVASAMAAFLAVNESLASLGNLLVSLVVAVAGMTLILGPWVWRLGQQVGEERRERIRSEERAEVAAHLHDSVLQTLAMIQRADEPVRMVSLARAQERELRAWLFGQAPELEDRLRPAVEAMAARLEQRHEVPVDIVVVGDAPLDDDLHAFVQACAEAITNAALHARASVVRCFVEVEPERVTAYVRDEGTGFDPAAVPPDRRGIAESIHGRMARYGGTAVVTSQAGEGTEVQLEMPRRRP
jgi:signal transduction histidine kinase/phage shock protein PspC (stress-responsive transcriptional regulator)